MILWLGDFMVVAAYESSPLTYDFFFRKKGLCFVRGQSARERAGPVPFLGVANFFVCFVSPMAGAHRPAGRFLESAFVLAATIGPGPSHHPHGTLLSNRLEGGRAEARKRRGGRYF